MSRKQQYRFSAIVIVIAVIFIAIVTLGKAGKQSADFQAVVTVKGGVITEGQSQTSFLQTPGKKCTFEVTVSGSKDLSSAAQFFKNATLTETIASLDLVSGSGKTEAADGVGDGVYLVLSRRIADGVTLTDGTYKISYSIKMVGEGGTGSLILMMLLILVVTVAFLWMMSYESGKEANYSKKRIRMRGKAFMFAFFVLTMMILTFALLDAVAGQFPFTTYQAGMISIIVAATVFVILADRLGAYIGFTERRGQIILMLSVIAAVNLIVVLIQLFSGKSSGGKVGNWIVNLVTAIAFFVMVISIMTKKNSTSSGSRGGRSGARRSTRQKTARTSSYDHPELYNTMPDPFSENYDSYTPDVQDADPLDDIDF